MDQARVHSTPMLEFPSLPSKWLLPLASHPEHILSVSRHKSYMHDQDFSNRWSHPRSIHSLSFSQLDRGGHVQTADYEKYQAVAKMSLQTKHYLCERNGP